MPQDTSRPTERTKAGASRTVVPASLTDKGFRIRGFGPLPDGFDPTSATPRQLTAQRLPRRPDADDEPELRALWDRAMSRTKLWITPEFDHREHITHGPAKQRRGRAVRRDRSEAPVIANATSSNWSGALSFAPQDKPYRFVGGQWTVPSPHAPGVGPFRASEWVGIDGWDSQDVLQAGTETAATDFVFFTATEVYAWWEWFPAGEVRINNLPVSPGDVMYCLICADSTSHATVMISNQSTGIGTRFDITPPKGTTLTGNVAEWIVERPTFNGAVLGLTDYAACYFDECIAGGSLHVDDLAGATLVTMTGSGGAALSEPTQENDHVVKLTWRNSS